MQKTLRVPFRPNVIRNLRQIKMKFVKLTICSGKCMGFVPQARDLFAEMSSWSDALLEELSYADGRWIGTQNEWRRNGSSTWQDRPVWKLEHLLVMEDCTVWFAKTRTKSNSICLTANSWMEEDNHNGDLKEAEYRGTLWTNWMMLSKVVGTTSFTWQRILELFW